MDLWGKARKKILKTHGNSARRYAIYRWAFKIYAETLLWSIYISLYIYISYIYISIYIYLFRGGSRKLSSESSLVISCAPTWDFSQFATEICYSPMITKQVPGGFMSQLLGFECHICPVAEIQSRREPWPVECFPSWWRQPLRRSCPRACPSWLLPRKCPEVWWCQQQQLLLCCESLSAVREAPKCLALKLQTCAIYP